MSQTTPSRTAAAAIAAVEARAKGRTRYDGCQPWDDELLVAHIRALEVELVGARSALRGMNDALEWSRVLLERERERGNALRTALAGVAVLAGTAAEARDG